jgi:hypothetical protein
LLNLRLLDEIDADTFAIQNTELRDCIGGMNLQTESTDCRARSAVAIDIYGNGRIPWPRTKLSSGGKGPTSSVANWPKRSALNRCRSSAIGGGVGSATVGK